MDPTQPLAGRVALITGASRGIGRQFALRLAAEGCAVVLAAKSETSTDRLPGSIHEVAGEVRAAGGRALARRLDVRDEEQVAGVVAAAVEEFGRLDILVNNAGAMWWRPLLETPPRRYDLMWQVNVRGSYLTMLHALPHMQRGGWGHVVAMSPPLTLTPSPGWGPYVTTKMAMTRLAISTAGELERTGVAVNSLWPAVPVESSATVNWPEELMGRREQWRSPLILCDALMEIVRQDPHEFSGRQVVDEVLLAERGWSQAQLDAYYLTGTAPADPLHIDGRTGALAHAGTFHACG